MAYTMTSNTPRYDVSEKRSARSGGGLLGVDPGDLSRIGLVSLVVGIAVLLLPSFVTLTFEWLIGLALIVFGGFEATHALPFRDDRGSMWHLALGLVGLAGGVLFIASPLTGALTLTLIVGLMFTAAGLVKTGFALTMMKLRGWTWAGASGLLTLAVGLVILFLLPMVDPWLLGILLGLEFLINGAWMLNLGRGRAHGAA